MRKVLALIFCLTIIGGLLAIPVNSFFESFDTSDSMPTGWSTIVQSESTVSNVWVHTADFDANSGTNMVKMYGNTDGQQDILVLVSPEVTSVSANQLNFYSKSSWGENTDTLIVGTLSNPTDFSTFNPVATYQMGADYVQFSVDFDASNTDSYIAFVNPLTSQYGYATYVDDVSWEPSTSVPNPAVAIYPEDYELNVLINFLDNIMTNSFEWSATGGNPTSYKLNFGTDNPPTNIISDMELGDVMAYASNTALNYSTQYFWQIIPTNDAGDAVNCPVWGFSTMSATVIDFNTVNSYSEGFETAEVGWLPLGMEQQNVNDDSAQWSGIASTDWSPNAHTGTMAVHMAFSFNSAHDDYLYTPPMYMIAGNTYHISFWYKTSRFDESIEKLNVLVGDSPVNSAMTTELWNNDNIINIEYAQATFDYIPTESGLNFLALHAYSEVLQMVLLVDDLNITEEETSSNEDNIVNPNSLSVSNFPNPFNPETTIEFSIPKGKTGSLGIYNLKGQLVVKYPNLNSQDTKIVWKGIDTNGNEAPSGTYFYRLSSDGKTQSGKMTLLK
ncbi:MAG: T9SS type A sorting domain-containing protein [Candidatus Zophobacter franzmannii]|nr:T9SS type A sorting domain-containing protein [Candidatus Zophobacter franzmannii]